MNKVASVKFTKTGYDDALFGTAIVHAKPLIVKLTHDNQKRESSIKYFGYRISFEVTLVDILQDDFNTNIQRLSEIFNSIIHTTNGTFRFYYDQDDNADNYYDCMLDSEIQPIGDNKTNTGHGVSFTISTTVRITENFDTFLQSLWYKVEV